MDVAIQWFEQAAQWLVAFVDQFGYVGLFVIGLVEIIPLPTTLVLIPAGYLAQQGSMSFAGVIIAKVMGTVCGATLNFWVVRRYGRGVVDRMARYIFLTDAKLLRLEAFFATHGPISILLGRLVPGVRHYLFLPAGVARMNMHKFAVFTGIGALIWTAPLVWIGYHFGANQALALEYVEVIRHGALVVTPLAIALYLAFYVKRRRRTRATLSR